MFLIELTYKADLKEIDAHMAAHVVFLKKHYAAGHFLVSGRKIPRDGGIILAIGATRQQSQVWLSRLPVFHRWLISRSITPTPRQSRRFSLKQCSRKAFSPRMLITLRTLIRKLTLSVTALRRWRHLVSSQPHWKRMK